MHTTSGRWKYGFMLALTTAVLWGILPIALKGLLKTMDANTVTWYRFLVSAVFTVAYLLIFSKTKQLPSFNRSIIGLLCIAIAGLTSNYIFYLKGLELSTPSTTQVVIQLAPILLLFGGLVLFKEHFNRWQWLGLLLFCIGILLFFNLQFNALDDIDADYLIGIVLVILASITWAAYALAQKQLLNYFSSNQVMVCIYIFGSLVFLPAAEPQQLWLQNQRGLWLLAFCCINTLFAYGCFAAALNHLEATRVSAILAITPLLTIVFMHIVALQFPKYIALEQLNLLSIAGACLIVCGAMLMAFRNVYEIT
jgi:drug/metabolite transporter (DMT)-like permease